MKRRSGRPRSLPAARVATLCLQLQHDLLKARSSLELPQTIDRMMEALGHAGRIEAIAVILGEHDRNSLIGGWQVPHDVAHPALVTMCPPPVILGLDGRERRCLASVATPIDPVSQLHLAAYGRQRGTAPAQARQWLHVALPLVVLAVRQAHQALSLTQSSVALEAEVERRTHEVLRLSASERELLDQLRLQTIQLQAANAELRHLDETKTGIISSVSHELRTPISTIKTLAKLLGHPDLPSRKYAQYLEVINAECDRQMGLVSDLLEMARLEAGSVPPSRSWQDLGPIVERVASRLREPIEASGQQLSVVVPPHLDRHVLAHSTELEQIVGNLLSNAHKFTNAGGRITVSIEPRPEAVTLIVADTGIGIGTAQTERIFDTFYRVPHPDRPITGTGVGLAIVRRLVANLGGTVSVQSQEGHGSVFTVTWPRR
jgi:signal transduction histidine kinase